MKNKVTCNYCDKELLRYKTKTNAYFCNLLCKAKWQIKQREDLGFTKEWLYSQYINKRKSADQIARDINRDSKRVWEWLRYYGIQLRPRGTDYGQNFKKGHSSNKGRRMPESHREKLRQLRLKDGHVPYLKDGQHWLHAYNVKPSSWRGGITPERQGVYSSLEWKDAVKEVWKRDNATCQGCGKHQGDYRDNKFHIHHIVSFQVKELRCNPLNLILLCQECHKNIHKNKEKRHDS